MRQTEMVKVAIRCGDGSVAIMSFITLGRGNVLPYGAYWENQELGWWRRPANDENIFQEISRLPHLNAQGYRKVNEQDIPVDRTFRDALEDDGVSLKHNMEKARKIHLDRLRMIRYEKFVELDGEWMRALGQNKIDEIEVIEAKRQALRDLPQTLEVEKAQTIEELKAIWSPLLGEYNA